MMNPLLLLSATELAARIREGDVTSREVVDAHIARIGQVNGTLNAVVRSRYDLARDEARAADDRALAYRAARASGASAEPLPPFLGVPCTVKESASLSGMPNSAGLVSRAGVIAQKDGTPVARLRAAGAIPLGVTNVSELCMWVESANRVYGLTSNAYDPARTAGGSSGGEGAIVGAGGVPFGLGSDIGGSIRLPAYFNGVFGHKPTGGLVPSTGQFPPPAGPAQRYLAAGPLARRAEDLMPFLRVLAGPDGEDAACVDMPLGDPSEVRLDGLTVVHIEDNGLIGVPRATKLAQRACLYHLAGKGARIREARIPELRHSLEIWVTMLKEAGGPSFRDYLEDGRPLDIAAEFVRLAAGRSDHTLPALILAGLEGLASASSALTRRNVALAHKLREAVEALLPAGTVALFPAYPGPAPRHDGPKLAPIDWVYSAIWNIVETPVTAVPLGLDDAGLPKGIQVIGHHGEDHVTIAVALELERAFGGWVPPPRWA